MATSEAKVCADCGKLHDLPNSYCRDCRNARARAYYASRKGKPVEGVRYMEHCAYCGQGVRKYGKQADRIAGDLACDTCTAVFKHMKAILEYAPEMYDRIIELCTSYAEGTDIQPKPRSARYVEEEMPLSKRLGVTDDDPITLALLNGHGLGPAPAEPESEFEFDDTPPTPEEKAAFDAEWREGVEALNAFAKERAKDQ